MLGIILNVLEEHCHTKELETFFCTQKFTPNFNRSARATLLRKSSPVWNRKIGECLGVGSKKSRMIEIIVGAFLNIILIFRTDL
jgi:hypothetical protein